MRFAILCMLVVLGTAHELPKKPSARVIVTKKGIDKAHEVIRQLIQERLKNIDLTPWTHDDDIHEFVLHGKTQVNNFEWPEYKYEIKPPMTMNLKTFEGLLNVTGHWKVTMKKPPTDTEKEITGEYIAILRKLELAMPIEIRRTEEGKPDVEAKECTFEMILEKLTFFPEKPDSLKPELRTHVEKYFDTALKGIMKQKICSLTKTSINENTADLLTQWPVRMPLTEKLPVFIDYTIMEEPKLEPERISAPLRGGMFWKGTEGTPFEPLPLPEVPEALYGKYMLVMQATDYLMNSYMYAMHQNGLFDYILTPESTEESKELFKTTCEKMCFGKISKELVSRFPDRHVHVHVRTKEPVTFFTKPIDGLKFKGLGEIVTYIPADSKNGPEKNFTLITADFNFEGDVEKITLLDNNRIHGAVAIKDIKLKLIESALPDVTQDTMEKVATFALQKDKSRFRDILDEVTGKGIPFPMLPGMTKTGEFELVFQEAAIVIGTDFEYKRKEEPVVETTPPPKF